MDYTTISLKISDQHEEASQLVGACVTEALRFVVGALFPATRCTVDSFRNLDSEILFDHYIGSVTTPVFGKVIA